MRSIWQGWSRLACLRASGRINAVRYRPLILLTSVALVALLLYYIDWRSTASRRVQAAAQEPRSVQAPSSPDQDDLIRRHLVTPLDGLRASDILDTFSATRSGGTRHEAAD